MPAGCNEATVYSRFCAFRVSVEKLRVELFAKGNDAFLIYCNPAKLMNRSSYIILEITIFHRGFEASHIMLLQ